VEYSATSVAFLVKLWFVVSFRFPFQLGHYSSFFTFFFIVYTFFLTYQPFSIYLRLWIKFIYFFQALAVPFPLPPFCFLRGRQPWRRLTDYKRENERRGTPTTESMAILHNFFSSMMRTFEPYNAVLYGSLSYNWQMFKK
jgi:hypothetical protein